MRTGLTMKEKTIAIRFDTHGGMIAQTCRTDLKYGIGTL